VSKMMKRRGEGLPLGKSPQEDRKKKKRFRRPWSGVIFLRKRLCKEILRDKNNSHIAGQRYDADLPKKTGGKEVAKKTKGEARK